MEILRVEELNAVYLVREGAIKAAVDISFEAEEGSITAVVGESASGKSTVLEAMTRSMPTNGRILKGQVLFRTRGGQTVDILKLSDEELRRIRWQEIAFVPQAAQGALNPTIRVFDHFLDTVADHGIGWPREKLWDRACQLLSLVGLESERVLRAFPHELSGGMKQRTLIALSLLFDPRLLILDEPTSALDVLTQARLISALAELQKKLGITMIFVTHDLPVAAELSDYISVIYGGNLVERGKTKDIIEASLHPYTQALVGSLMSVVGDVSKIKPIPGEPPSLLNPPPGCIFHPRCPHAMEVCKKERPPLFNVGDRHFVRCWLYKREG